MLHRLKTLTQAIGRGLRGALAWSGNALAKPFGTMAKPVGAMAQSATALARPRAVIAMATLAALALAGYALVTRPPLHSVPNGQVLLRSNTLSGELSLWRDGTVWVLPGVHQVRLLSLRDQFYRPSAMAKANGPAPLQSIEGMSIGLDLTVRFALDATRLAQTERRLPDDIAAELVGPALQGVVYKQIAQHSVREIFSSKRAEIQKAIEDELRTQLAADGVLLRSLQIGQVDLPADYRQGLDGLLAEGLATEKMRYTLELKEKRVKETELVALADKVRRETAADAAAREQIIAAKAQEEAMKHVLPFKQRMVEQRQLEAEAERVVRIKAAEGSSQARRIEAQGEADARQKLADAEAYRVTKVGQSNAQQMALEGALITKHPLLIQKTLADKLSDKIQVIIAPPPAAGGFIAQALIDANKRGAEPVGERGAQGGAEAATKAEEQ